jgi:hypothetical protein
MLAARVAFAQDAADAGTAPSATNEKLPAAEPLSFKAALEKAEVTIGEPFKLNIEVRHKAEETYALPPGLTFPGFGVRESTNEVHGEDPRTTLFRLTLQAFNIGDQEIPAIRLVAQTASGARQLEIPPQKLKVNGVIDLTQGEPQLREDTKPLPTRYRTVWWPLALICAVLAGVLAGIYLRRRAKRPALAPPPKPRLPAYEEAMERLTVLESEGLVGTGQQQAYYFRLSEILRDYVGRRYDFDSLELTTDELLVELRSRSTPGLHFDGLTAFLREADLVKFARSQPTDGECKSAMDVARSIVERSRPVMQTVDVQGRAG